MADDLFGLSSKGLLDYWCLVKSFFSNLMIWWTPPKLVFPTLLHQIEQVIMCPNFHHTCLTLIGYESMIYKFTLIRHSCIQFQNYLRIVSMGSWLDSLVESGDDFHKRNITSIFFLLNSQVDTPECCAIPFQLSDYTLSWLLA